MKKIFVSLTAMLILLPLAFAGSTTIGTDKNIYTQGEIVKFTLYNNNTSSIEMDFKPSIVDNNTGKCIWGCIWIAVYNPIIIPPGGNYSWTWDQKDENGKLALGTYKGNLGEYHSNNFEIVVNGTILSYYRGLGVYPDKVETSDLLKAAHDWINNTAPPGFSMPITVVQLTALADEWKSNN
jgi:hypothetical protein